MASRAVTNPFSPSNPSSLTVISITKILQSLKPHNLDPHKINNPQNFPSLSQFSPHLTPNLVIQVIKTQTNPYHALFFFNWASMPSPNPTNYTHTFPCYLAMLDQLLSHQLFNRATQFLETHNKVSDFTVAKMIKGYGASSNIRGAIDWFQKAKMRVNGGDCIKSCNALLTVLVRANKIDLARAVFDRVVKEGVIKLDVVSYTSIIRGYCKMGMVEDAQKLFDEMPCRPNAVTYGTLVNGYSRKGMMVNARQIVDMMIVSGDCLPDLVTYTALIDGYCKKGEMEEAMRYFDEMVMQGIEPNLVTYNAIVNGFCLIGKVDEARKMMTRMRLNGLKDNVVTHTSLLRGLCVVGRLDEAFKHLKDMSRLGMKLDVKAYGVLVNECCRLGRVNEAIDLLKEMIEIGVSPSVSSFCAVLKVLVEKGELDDAVLLLKGMPDLGYTPNFLSYLAVIPSLSKIEGRVQEVEELVSLMLRDGHKFDASLYSCLINMYCNCGDLKMATQVFSDALSTRYVIKLDSFAVFMEDLCAKGKIAEAEKHFEQMHERCQVPDLDSYQKILRELICKYSNENHQES